jgi:hypothetical protein
MVTLMWTYGELHAETTRSKALTIEPQEEAKRLKDVVLKILCAVHGSSVCAVDFDEMKKEQDHVLLHGVFQTRSRLGRTHSVVFTMELDKQNQLISYSRERTRARI